MDQHDQAQQTKADAFEDLKRSKRDLDHHGHHVPAKGLGCQQETGITAHAADKRTDQRTECEASHSQPGFEMLDQHSYIDVPLVRLYIRKSCHNNHRQP